MHTMSTAIEAGVARAMADDAGSFLQQMDLVLRRALFVRLSQEDLRAASFLDERLGMQGREGFWVPLRGIAEVASAMAHEAHTADFIFHIGHCGSTLLSRLLDQDAGILGLREPLVLRELAVAERELESTSARLSTDQWQRLFADALAILGRRFAPEQKVIIKATSSCNNLIERVLAFDARVRIVLMYLPLESYLATMMKAPGGGLDVLHGAPARLQFLDRALGGIPLRLHQLDTAETVAMGWVAELLRFQQIRATAAYARRVMLLDFEKLLEDPATHLHAVRAHMGLAELPADNAALMQSAVMRAYAKSPTHAYTPADRAHDLDLSRRRFGNEIARGMAFAEKLLGEYPQCEPLRTLLR
jgi:hypothetical protein